MISRLRLSGTIESPAVRRKRQADGASISTVFECAFLTALLRLAQRAESIMLPAGEVDARELRRVVVALLCGRDEQQDAA